MKIMVAFNGSPAARNALALACKDAARLNARVFIVNSMEGGSGENVEMIQQVENYLNEAKALTVEYGVQAETIELARGLSPGEDLVQFAEENAVDVIYIGIQKTSRTRKILLGSTAQYVILRGPCPVMTTK